MRLLIIIPAYNEEDNIEKVVNLLKKSYPQYDYVVVNDGSSDDTGKICRKNGFNTIHLPVNLGLASGFQAGMKYAELNNYDAAIQFDGDGQHNPQFIEEMLSALENHDADIIIGSRFVNQKKPVSMRMFGNNLIQGCIFLTTKQKIKDPTSGMRLYNKKMIHKLAHTMNCGPEPDTIAYLIRCGAKIKEVPVEMQVRTAGESYLNAYRSMQYMVHMLLSILIIQWFRMKGL